MGLYINDENCIIMIEEEETTIDYIAIWKRYQSNLNWYHHRSIDRYRNSIMLTSLPEANRPNIVNNLRITRAIEEVKNLLEELHFFQCIAISNRSIINLIFRIMGVVGWRGCLLVYFTSRSSKKLSITAVLFGWNKSINNKVSSAIKLVYR